MVYLAVFLFLFLFPLASYVAVTPTTASFLDDREKEKVLFTPNWYQPQHKHPFGAEPVKIAIVNLLPFEIVLRSTPPGLYSKPTNQKLGSSGWEQPVAPNARALIKTSVGYRFYHREISCDEKHSECWKSLSILPGKHLYELRRPENSETSGFCSNTNRVIRHHRNGR